MSSSKSSHSFGDRLMDMFAYDKRSIALFRIFIGLIGITDLIQRWPDIKAHYTDFGFVPRSFAMNTLNNQYWHSIHFYGIGESSIQVLFLIHGLVYFFFLVGYRPRLMSVIIYFFQTSLYARNTLILLAADFL